MLGMNWVRGIFRGNVAFGGVGRIVNIERGRALSIRDKINANQNIVVVVAVVVIAVALIWIFTRGGGGGAAGTGEAYYYDTVTEEVFTAKANQYPPIESPDGNPAVRVHFFSCGDCSEAERFIGFYDKYTDEAKRKLETATEQEMYEMSEYETGVLNSVDGQTWLDPASEQFQMALQEKLNCPEGGRARYCRAK